MRLLFHESVTLVRHNYYFITLIQVMVSFQLNLFEPRPSRLVAADKLLVVVILLGNTFAKG